MLEVILRCGNGIECLSPVPQQQRVQIVSNRLDIDNEGSSWGLAKEAVLEYVNSLGWQLVRRFGFGIYVCVVCAGGEKDA